MNLTMNRFAPKPSVAATAPLRGSNRLAALRAHLVLGALVLGCLAAAAPAAHAQDAYATAKTPGNPSLPIAIPKGQFVKVASLRLPAGDFVATTSLWMTNTAQPAQPLGIAYCMLVLKDAGSIVANAQVIDSSKGGEGVSQALTVAGTLFNGGTADVLCTNNGLGGSLLLQTVNLNAIHVFGLQVQ